MRTNTRSLVEIHDELEDINKDLKKVDISNAEEIEDAIAEQTDRLADLIKDLKDIVG